MKSNYLATILVRLLNYLCLAAVLGQVTTTFTYRGGINSSGFPANGPSDRPFEVFEAPTSGGGTNDKHVPTVDADGAALAAIQGLNEKVEVRSERPETRIQRIEAENAELKQRLAELEQLVTKLVSKGN